MQMIRTQVGVPSCLLTVRVDIASEGLYSQRSVCIGSTFAARLAGERQAIAAQITRSTATLGYPWSGDAWRPMPQGSFQRKIQRRRTTIPLTTVANVPATSPPN